MKESVSFGSARIDFALEYSERKTLGITVTPELNVIVKAPLGANVESIRSKVLKRAPWILRQQSFFLSFLPKTPSKKYVGGETHLYLGRQYRLKIILGEEELVKLRGEFLEVSTADKASVSALVKSWYNGQANFKLKAIALPLIERFKKYKVEPTSVVLREMPSRWGSCTPKGKIILNPELIKAPKGCIEYVIIHELCHLIHYDHTKKFFDLQSKEMKNWQIWKFKLEKLLA